LAIPRSQILPSPPPVGASSTCTKLSGRRH
jgi:hypothetical protein